MLWMLSLVWAEHDGILSKVSKHIFWHDNSGIKKCLNLKLGWIRLKASSSPNQSQKSRLWKLFQRRNQPQLSQLEKERKRRKLRFKKLKLLKHLKLRRSQKRNNKRKLISKLQLVKMICHSKKWQVEPQEKRKSKEKESILLMMPQRTHKQAVMVNTIEDNNQRNPIRRKKLKKRNKLNSKLSRN